MRIKTMLLCSVVVAMLCSSVMAGGITFRERWDGYAEYAPHAPNYVAEWVPIGTNLSFPIELGMGSYGGSGTNNAIQARRWYGPSGIAHDLRESHSVFNYSTKKVYVEGPKLASCEMVIGTDTDVLVAYFDFDIQVLSRYKADLFMEISLDGAHAPNSMTSGPVDALAFGAARGLEGRGNYAYVFDGNDWIETNIYLNVKRWHRFTFEVSATQFTLIDDCPKRSPRIQSQTFDRKYLGGFNTVSMRQIGQETGKHRYADKTYLSGGSIVCVPVLATMDVLPSNDPNDFTVLKKADSKARLPMEVYGSEELDVADIDLGSIRVAGTVIPVKVSNDGDENMDGYADLVIHVNRVDLINALDLSNEIGNVVEVVVTGVAAGGCPCFEATDVVIPQAP